MKQKIRVTLAPHLQERIDAAKQQTEKARQMFRTQNNPRINGLRKRLSEMSEKARRDELTSEDRDDLIFALYRKTRINQALRIVLELPKKEFQALSHRIRTDLSSASPDLQVSYYWRAMRSGVDLQKDEARGALRLAASQMNPALLDALLQKGFPGWQEDFGDFPRLRVLGAIESARDPGCGAILARFVNKDPSVFVAALRVNAAQLANNPKPALAIVIATRGSFDHKTLEVISRALGSSTPYASLFHDSTHGELARRAYAQRWDLEQFISLPLREIRTLDARARAEAQSQARAQSQLHSRAQTGTAS